MAEDVTREQEENLPRALVRAFTAAGRPVMPTTKGGVPRTEEVRDTLTRVMANTELYFAYRRDMEAAFLAFGVGLPLDRAVVPHAEYDDADIAANGFTNVSDPNALAALALDPSAFEGINQLLFDEIPAGRAGPKEVGPWLAQAQERWPVVPYLPPKWVLDKLRRCN